MHHNQERRDANATAGDKLRLDTTYHTSLPEASRTETKVETTSQKISAFDVTKDFAAAASALQTGQLVKDEFFTLFDAVGALEIMDSKMDNGHLKPGETLDDDYDILSPLLPDKVLGIMDQILCHEVAWHKGHPLSQTLFTCLYIERLLWPEPETLEQAQFLRNDVGNAALKDPILHLVLRSYCIATIKACHLVHSLVTSESYYEEEDFTSQLYHRQLLPKVSTEEAHLLVDEALEYISATSLSLNVLSAIQSRLLFRRRLLTALEQEIGPLKARKNLFVLCLPLLQDIRDTTKFGAPVSGCFSIKIQRSLASSVPPRPMVNISLSDALLYLEALCHDAADVEEILNVRNGEDLFAAVSVFMDGRPQPSVYVRALVQSFLGERTTGKVLGRQTPKQFLFSNLEALVLPSSLMLDPKHELLEVPTNPAFQATSLLSQFDEKAGQQYLNGFRSACLNRCRTRRTLCHLVIELDVLQAETEEIDSALRSYTGEKPTLYASEEPTYFYPLTSWVYHHKLNHVRQIIQLGFELTVYAPDELAGMYWYLSYICGTHLSHIDRMSFFIENDLQTRHDVAQSTSSTGDLDLEYQTSFRKTFRNLFRIQNVLKATDAFSRALHALHTLLLRHDATSTPDRPYSSDQLRYQLRMKPFLCLSLPESVEFDNFQPEKSLVGLDDDRVLAQCAVKGAEARRLWDEVLKAGWCVPVDETAEACTLSLPAKAETQGGGTTVEDKWSAGVKNVIRACIATNLCVAALKRKSEDGSLKDIQAKMPLPGDKECWHDWWIVPQISHSS